MTSGMTPGVLFGKTVITFCVSIPFDKKARLLIYQEGSDEIRQSLQLEALTEQGDIRSISLPTEGREQIEYNFEIDGERITDPYAEVIRDGKSIAYYDRYDWRGDHPEPIRFEDMILYKLHVRGFTMNQTKEEDRGTFAALRERIPYLTELGINGVEFMPMYEWSEKLKDLRGKGRNFWGYAEENRYFAPKTSFADGSDVITECRDMIRALHQAGIACIMEFFFPTGTNPLLAWHALRYWREKYHVDGFHVIGGGVPLENLVRDPYLSQTCIMVENIDTDWVYGGDTPVRRHLAEYHDGFQNDARRFVKGDEGMTASFVYNMRRNPSKCGAVNYVTNTAGFTLTDLVSYDRKHNEINGEDNRDGSDYNYSWNCGVEGPTRKTSINRLRQQQKKNLMAYLLLSQGVPLIRAGDENGNTQSGNSNAYSLDNTTGWVSWSSKKSDAAFREYVRRLIAFRKEHTILHMAAELRMTDYKAQGLPDLSYHDERAWYSQFENSQRYIGVLYNEVYAGDSGVMYIAFNAYWEEHPFAIPVADPTYTWNIVLDTSKPDGHEFDARPLALEQEDVHSILVPARSVMILTGR